ncbi:hypothetical protein O6H91_11G069500 [Diphasiastrum complanatum]|uniref:Uncharacterized protein n=1 Tax=Diphasiastrum complanatum TaxID=34168 RepID=A0ACC2CAD9_DIPCM|nr:hypothetical protein O6H91_11G069500 [Diphasiastrum complanatum]
MKFEHRSIVGSPMLRVCTWPLMLAIYCASYVNLGAAKSFIEPCATADSCSALVSYRLSSEMKIKDIALLFSVDTITLFGTNNIDLSLPDPENLIIAENETIVIPISCACINGIRRGNSTIYVVKSGDTLSAIASTTFGGLVSYQQVADANQITDPNKITVGQQLVIPFPCACHNALYNNRPAIFLSYLVQPGDSVDQIAANFSLTSANLMDLNNINSSSNLFAGDVVEIPVHDYGLFVASGSYVITAQHCVQCSCSDSLQEVYCTPAPATLSGSCPSSACYGSNLTIGQLNSNPSFESCTVTSCVYDGFKRKSILSSLQVTTQGSCPALPSLLPYRTFPMGVASSPAYAPVNAVPYAPPAIPTTGGASGPTSSVTLTVDASLTPTTFVLLYFAFLLRLS